MNERVIITGSEGYIGTALVNEARRRRMPCLPVDKERGRDRAALRLNLCNRAALSEAVRKFRPTLCIHAGTHSAAAYRDRFLASFAEDFRALRSVLESLDALPRCRVVYFSSSYVYNGLKGRGQVSEESPLKPAHPFGVAKSFFEQLLLRSHPESTVFRLSSVFGSGQAKHPNTIQNFAKEAAANGVVTIWGAGARKLQYVSMNDVVRCVFESTQVEPGVYNLCGDEYPSVGEAAQRVARFFRAKTVFLKEKPEGETLPRMTNAKVKTAFGTNPFTPFCAALANYLASFS